MAVEVHSRGGSSRPAKSTQPLSPGPFQGLENIGRGAAGTDSQGHISRARQGLQLPQEDVLEKIVVADARQNGGVHGEGDGRQRRPFFLESVHELGGNVLSVGRTPTVSKKKQSMVFTKGPADDLGHFKNGLRLFSEELLFETNALTKGFPNDCLQSVHRNLSHRYPPPLFPKPGLNLLSCSSSSCGHGIEPTEGLQVVAFAGITEENLVPELHCD